jgi:hypothetical protein
MQVSEFDQVKASTAKELDSMLKRYQGLDAGLFAAQSKAAVEILQRSAHAAQKEMQLAIESRCSSVIEASHMQLSEVLDAFERCEAALRYNRVQRGVSDRRVRLQLQVERNDPGKGWGNMGRTHCASVL